MYAFDYVLEAQSVSRPLLYRIYPKLETLEIQSIEEGEFTSIRVCNPIMPSDTVG